MARNWSYEDGTLTIFGQTAREGEKLATSKLTIARILAYFLRSTRRLEKERVAPVHKGISPHVALKFFLLGILTVPMLEQAEETDKTIRVKGPEGELDWVIYKHPHLWPATLRDAKGRPL